MPEDWDKSAQAWIDAVEEDVSRLLVLDPVMLDESGDVRGKLICDIGSGEGRFARMLAARGGKVVAFDPTVRLLEEARAKGDGPVYLRAVAEHMPLQSGFFDIAVSYVTLVDIPDYRRAIAEMSRILKPGGRLLAANLNAFVTPSPYAWVEDESGRRLHVAVDNYFGERKMTVAWKGIEIENWHRPMSDYFDALLSAGLRLSKYIEPRPSPEDLRCEPRLNGSDRVPYFHVMVWEKPE